MRTAILKGSFAAALFVIMPALALAQTAGSCLTLPSNLGVGMSDATTGGNVSLLQAFLLSKGDFSYTVTGYYGPITAAAVKKYQASQGISTTGFVGPLTRAAIAKSCSAPSTAPTTQGTQGAPAQTSTQTNTTGAAGSTATTPSATAAPTQITTTPTVTSTTAGALTVTRVDHPAALAVGQQGTWVVHIPVPASGVSNLQVYVVWNDESQPGSSISPIDPTVSQSATDVAVTLVHTYKESANYTQTFTLITADGAKTSYTTSVSVK